MRALGLAFVLACSTGCSAFPPPPATVEYRDVDEARMATIEERAAYNGVRVYWINPPRKAGSTAD